MITEDGNNLLVAKMIEKKEENCQQYALTGNVFILLKHDVNVHFIFTSSYFFGLLVRKLMFPHEGMK